ncbi:MAG: helicase HerA-like domain-containing protein [Pseudomonadota bacterium]
MNNAIFLGGGGPDYGEKQSLPLKYANRHGLIAGATGTGKTVTLQILAEGFSAAGVPVVVSDVKGDLSGLAQAGSEGAKLHQAFQDRASKIGFDDYAYAASPVCFWDLFGEQGHPVRTTIAEMGPLLLARLLDLSEPQEGILNIAFRLADDEGLALLDLDDLRAMLAFVGERRAELALLYGNIATASIGAIQRRLLVLENQGANQFFGEPALELSDLMRVNADGLGQVNIIAADKLMASPRLYATFLLWLLSELFEELPEVGDPDKPRLVFFFDEAHLLFDGAPKALVDKVEQVARLIRSKGVGVYFVTQTPSDIPEDVLSQLGNRIQHALRAFTAKDRKALSLAAQTYRPNPLFSTEDAIRDVGIGEAVTSMLQKKGVPGVVERTLIRPPSSHLGPIDPAARRTVMQESDLAAKYKTPVDRRSAHEILVEKAGQAAQAAEQVETATAPEAEQYQSARRYSGTRVGPSGSRRVRTQPDFGDELVQMVRKELTGTTGRRIVRGLLGGMFKGR